ncbi:MAG: HAD-IA family hydrolase [bacterium]|nr:HAD-IA family hydrolase [bacterium]
MSHCSNSHPIRNVIFDIGGVMVTFDPGGFAARLFDDPADRDFVLKRIFGGPEWIEMDRGVLPLSDGISLYHRLYPEHGAAIDRLFERWWDMFEPIPATLDIVRELKSNGAPLYILSNFMEEPFQRLIPRWGFWPLFDGAVVSYQVRCVKPEREIYDNILTKYGLSAAETLFIDDMQHNVDGALAAGLQAIRFESPERLREDLRRLGALAN